jgi:hypothetical protein
MKKGLWIAALLVALVVALLLSQVAFAGGKRLDFQIEPGCAVDVTIFAAPGRLGARTFTVDRTSWEDEPPFITLQGGASYQVVLWCPETGHSGGATIHVQAGASGQQDIWFPLHNAEPGVFQGFYVTGGLESEGLE